jgi:parallel beta-helix repeat protein
MGVTTKALAAGLAIVTLVAGSSWNAAMRPPAAAEGPGTVKVAPPTGVRDADRSSILAALEEVQPGGVVQFAAGTYLMGGEIIRVTVPRITLLGHGEGTTLRGCEPDEFPTQNAFEFGNNCNGIELAAASQTVRNLTFEHAFWALHVGCCWSDFPHMRADEGGHLIEGNTFRSSSNAVRVHGFWTEPTVIRNNRLLNNWHSVAIYGNTVHLLENDISVPEPEAVQGLGFPAEGVHVAGPLSLREGEDAGTRTCENNVVAGNRIDGATEGILMTANEPGIICRNNVIRDNTIAVRRARPPAMPGFITVHDDTDSTVVGVPLALRGLAGESTLEDNLIEGNVIVGAEGLGIEIRHASRNRIVNNTVTRVVRREPFPGNSLVAMPVLGGDPEVWRDANGSGIWISPGSHENEIVNNAFEDIAGAAIVLEGDGNVVQLRRARDTVRDLGAGNRLTAPNAAVGRTPEPHAGTRTIAEVDALYRARVDSARARVSEADVRFMTGMIAHHAQALAMSRLADTRDAGPAVRLLAARITNAQADEIALMQKWLRDRGRPVPEVHVTDTAVVVHGAEHAAHARGMLSVEQLHALEQAGGTGFDRLFLYYMIQHHRGAIAMVRELLRTDGAAQDPAVSMLANAIHADQAIEITLMLRLLAETREADPRVGLGAGLFDAEQVVWNLNIVANALPPDEFVGEWNSDLAFTGNHVIQGNALGFQIWDVGDPARPELVSVHVCPGSQGDVTVHGQLLFVSVEGPEARLDCGTQGVAEAVSAERLSGIRIFDISDVSSPRLIANVQTCRGSHTNTLLVDPNDPDYVYILVSGTLPTRPAEELAGCEDSTEVSTVPVRGIEVIQVPLSNPAAAAVASRPSILDGLVAPPRHGMTDQDRAAMQAARARGEFVVWVSIYGEEVVVPDEFAGPLLAGIVEARGGTGAPTAADSAALRAQLPAIVAEMIGDDVPEICHDITAYPAIGLAGAACIGHGLLLDIRDPLEPKRLTAVADSNFIVWHSATFNNDGTKVLFSDEWGGGTQPKCRATDPPHWGANAIYAIEDGRLVFRSYYKMPAVQTAEENCVAHNGSLIPIPGRDVMVQSWLQGGVSVFDWTDAASPFEIAFHDRGPVDTDELVVAGSWSAYWYNGYIYSSEFLRGLDIFELVPSAHLSQNEIDAAKTVRLDHLNVQTQPRFVWPASFPLVRAYVDQLERSNGLTTDRIAAVRRSLADAEGASSAARRQALVRLAADLDEVTHTSGDPKKATMVVDVLRELALTGPGDQAGSSNNDSRATKGTP